MVCARLPDSTRLKKTLALDRIRYYSRCPALFDSLRSLWYNTSECVSPSATFNDLLFKIAVRSDMLCILVAGLLDAFVTAYNLQGTNSGPTSASLHMEESK